MTQFETLTTIFDTAVWAIVGDGFSADDKRKIIDELHSVLHSLNEGYDHEKPVQINGVWTQSGSSKGWTIARTCLSERKSFFVVISGQVIALNEKDASYLRVGGWIEMGPGESSILLATPDTRMIRVFVDDFDALKAFAEKYDA